jgi:hypothetical protein
MPVRVPDGIGFMDWTFRARGDARMQRSPAELCAVLAAVSEIQ